MPFLQLEHSQVHLLTVLCCPYRCNRKPPGMAIRRFSKSDPRYDWALKEFDPRVHFALVCGTMSCPRLRAYSIVPRLPVEEDMITRHSRLFESQKSGEGFVTGDLDEELSMATRDYLKDNISLFPGTALAMSGILMKLNLHQIRSRRPSGAHTADLWLVSRGFWNNREGFFSLDSPLPRW